jgi:acyl dehydratase
MEFRFDQLGHWTEERSFEVTAEGIRLYAAATNDTNPRHIRGDVASPIFAVVPALTPVFRRALAMAMPSEATGYDTRRVHGEQDMFLLKPILPGMHLRSRAAPIGIQVKSTGTLVIAKTETRTERGELINYQYVTNFVRGVRAGRSEGEQVPIREVPAGVTRTGPQATIAAHVDADQTFRYAEASGDRGIYHLDVTAARSAGFPGLILHGLCTMAFASRAVVESVCDNDSTRLERIAVRFARPVLLDQDITTTIWAAGRRDNRDGYVFEVVDASGQAVITMGVAEVRT